MKELYHPRSKLRVLYLKRILILLAIFIISAVVLSYFNFAIFSLFSPVWKAKNVIVNGNNIPTTIEEQSRENRLLELVGRKQEPKIVIAAVLTYPPQTPYDIIIIDAGSNDSVTVGSEVSLPEGPLLGKVTEVFSKSAKVKLFSSSGEETATILERNDVPVILVGSGGGNFRISLPRDIEVEIGDMILSADVSSRLLAIVADIDVKPTDALKEVIANSPTNIFSLRYVFVTP